MIVLTRKADQKIMIGDDIVVTVVHIRASTVRLGIDAPEDTKIFREELTRFTDERGTDEITED